MATPQSNNQIQLTELSTNAFEAFCHDVSEMFGVETKARVSSASGKMTDELQKRFEKLSAAIRIHAEGVLNGDFHMFIDRQGLFTLAGTITLLPEQEILDFRENGSETDAEELYDAVGETGNLFVDSWDRIFREGLEGHIRFTKTHTFIGNPWDESEKNEILSEDEAVLFLPCEITVSSFPAFQCGVLFSDTVCRHLSDTAAESVPEEDVEPEEAEASETSEQITNGEQLTEDTDSPSDVPAGPDHRQTAGGAVSRTIQKMVQSLPIIPQEHAQTLLAIQAKDIMNKEILWGRPEDSVQEAREKMQQTGAACMMVGRPDSLQGIVSWLNIAEAVSIYLQPAFSKWRRLADDATLQIRLKAIMSRPVHTINLHTTLSEIIDDMCENRCRCLPVVNEDGQVEGFVSAFDIFRLLMRMTPDISNPSPMEPAAAPEESE
jgi:CBS domain-containing protein